MKIRLVGTVLFLADGRADRQAQTDRHDKANSRLSQFFERT